MLLISGKVERFKSIEELTIENVGNFNVLIGKNNSGKSNILSSVDIFFNCLQTKHPVSINIPIKNEIDFYNKSIDTPIRISFNFELNEGEINQLIQDIVTDAPQMKNAIEAFSDHYGLSITLTITRPPKIFGFISKISIFKLSLSKLLEDEIEIFEISEPAANEIYEKVFAQKKYLTDSKLLSKIDRDELEYYFTRMRETKDDNRPPSFEYFFRRSPSASISKDTSRMLNQIYSESKTPDEFEKSMRRLQTHLQEEADLIVQTPISMKISTFSGEGQHIPNYVIHLLNRISKIRILHLIERRPQIGREDAQKLLELKIKRGGPKILYNIQSTVENLLGVKIDAFSGESLRRSGESVAEIDVDNFLVEVNGSGIREALRIILDVEFEHPQILLVEEPELNLHPGLEISMMRYLKSISANCQVFLTTHSTNFIDSGEMHNIYLVSRDGPTKIKLLNAEEIRTDISKELGIRLSSLFVECHN